MIRLLKHNNIYLGILLAMVAPVISYGLLWLINLGIEEGFNDGSPVLQRETLLMSSIFLNLIIFLPYLKSDKYDRTGRGVLLVTFIGVVILFLTLFN